VRKSVTAWVVLAAVAIVGRAGAQTPLDLVRAQNAAAHQAEMAQQDLLATQREIAVRQDEARTALVLRELDSARTAPSAVLLRGTVPPSAPSPDVSQGSFAAQMDRIERLTQDALSRGNARIRAIRPASDH